MFRSTNPDMFGSDEEQNDTKEIEVTVQVDFVKTNVDGTIEVGQKEIGEKVSEEDEDEEEATRYIRAEESNSGSYGAQIPLTADYEFVDVAFSNSDSIEIHFNKEDDVSSLDDWYSAREYERGAIVDTVKVIEE